MTFDLAEWGPPLVVILVAGLGGGFLALSLRRDEKDSKTIADSGREEDLIRRQEEALQALASLEIEKSNMLPEDYEAERRALLQKGADAMRLREQGQAPPAVRAGAPATAAQQKAMAAMDGLTGAGVGESMATESDDALGRGIAELTGALKRGEIDEVTFAKAVAALSAQSSTAPAAPAAPAAPSAPARPASAPASAPAAPRPGISGTPQKPPMISPAWKGAIYVIAAIAVIGGLLFWADSQSVQRRDGASMTGNQDLGGESPAPKMPPQMQQRVQAAEAALANNPKDVAALNVLTSMNLRSPQQAYPYNQRALEADPNDLEARMFDGVITAMMGMPEKAQAKFDAIIETDPNHGPTWAYKGLILAESQQWKEAEVALLKARELGIQDHTLDQALAIAQNGGVPPTGTQLPGPPPGPAAAGGATIVSGTIEIDPNRANFKASDLYVSVKDPNLPGPPLAAKKLPPGPFPISFVITEADRPAMGGPMGKRPIPESFTVTVRLDKDGNAMTKEEGEPQQTVPASVGDKLKLTLQ